MAEIADEESQTLDPGFWDDPKKAEAHMRKIREKKVWTEAFSVIENSLGDVDVLVEFQEIGEATAEEVHEQYEKLVNQVEELEFKNMLQNEEDHLGCVLEINAGAGGTESCDWAEMLMRMIHAVWVS